MKAVAAALRRVGGPASVTWVAFVLSTFDRAIASGVPQVGIVQPAFLVRIPYVLAAQLVMFAPLALLWLLQQRRPQSRPALTLFAFLLAAVLRGWSYDLFLHLGLGTPRAWEGRLLGSTYTIVLILLVCSFVANTLLERRQELANLLEVRARLERARAAAEASVQQRNDELIREVHSVLEGELASIDGRRASEAVAALRRTAAEVIRPLSHDLAGSYAEQTHAAEPRAEVRLGWRELLADAGTDSPFRPMLTIAVLSGIYLSVVALVPGFGLPTILSLVVVALVLAGGNLVFRRFLRDVAPVARLILVGLIAVVAGFAMEGMLLLVIGPRAWTTTIAPASVYYVAVVSTVGAFVNIVLAARGQLLLRTETSTEELRRQLVRTRQVDWFHQRALAAALHGPVQSAVEAAALRLDDESGKGLLNSAVVDDVRAQLLRSLDVLESPADSVGPFAIGLERITATWQGVCDVRVQVSEAAALALEEDVVARSTALSILTEAVSNSIRHGKSRAVSVEVRRDGPDLVLCVVDDGRERVERPGRGLGSSFLDDCTLEWSLGDEGQVVGRAEPASAASGRRLEARLPLGST